MNGFHLTPAAPKGRRPGSRGTTASFDSGNLAHQAGAPSVMAQALEPHRTPRKLVLCFDGTGNKFRGDDSDSNILKIFRSLDREAGDQYHYYQPGIGTYIVSTSLSHTSLGARIRSWYLKAKDSAIGSSFDQHVVGGYRFLMRFYNPGDEIYFFGFSRGAYVARFLAEMLDYVGLLSHGNEEMVVFAWKAFSQWQARNHDDSPEGREKRHEMYRFMKGFRETFSRPVKRIRFLGLFDTVNSVPRFETAWMQRSKFPYTARSSAKVIRHCVSIDERRAKFRQDLMYQKRPEGRHHHHVLHDLHEKYRARRSSLITAGQTESSSRGRRATLAPPTESAFRSHSRSGSQATRSTADGQCHVGDARSEISRMDEDDSDDDEQDIDEICPNFSSGSKIHFSNNPLNAELTVSQGGHGDVGGGWEILPGSKSASHVPLVYMIRQAEKAGLTFDSEKLIEMGLADAIIHPDTTNNNGAYRGSGGETQVPDIRIDVSGPSPMASPTQTDHIKENWGHFNTKNLGKGAQAPRRPFHEMMHKAHIARIHDSLEFSSGLGTIPVISWNFMEYLPFRRMDLQADGSWKPIRWPLPAGETRDIPHTARVHGSVIRRMNQDPTYRPGNLIIGGGGRGKRRAPEELGIGEWECVEGHDDPVDEVWIKKSASPADA
ncbi:hypothetical protein F5Y12DRAFT_710981 [Xylaria sp. FL1777]|nr:hypothetical protein F5Y12DRAFT_710981 [Xylaria sp. FL1777]